MTEEKKPLRNITIEKLQRKIANDMKYLPCFCGSGKKYKFCCYGKKRLVAQDGTRHD